MGEHTVRQSARLDNESWALLSDTVAKFEETWRVSPPAHLAGFVPEPKHPLRRQLLVELIKVDQEHRWSSGDSRLLEAYLAEWQELAISPELVAELLEAECLTRAGFGCPATAAELNSRFPTLAHQVDLEAIHAAATAEQGPPVSPGIGDLPGLDTSSIGQHDTNGQAISRASDDAPPKRFGRYEVRGLLGRGGMGAVYRAYDPQLDREIALKVPRFDVADDPSIRERFLREGRAAAALRHPNICPIFDAGQVGDAFYLAMALIEGQSLAKWLQDRKISGREAASLVLRLARALEKAHAAGVIHRDIKPSNVIMDEAGEPILVDFGLARQTRDVRHLTTSGSLLGTPAYMSPEQVRGEAHALDARTDVYGLGVLLYHLLTGRLPFNSPFPRLLGEIEIGHPPRPSTVRRNVDSAIDAICLKAMAHNPSDRYQTAGGFAAALEAYLQRELRHVTRPPNRSRIWLSLAGAALVFLAGVLIYLNTGEGTLVLEVSDPDVSVTIDGRQHEEFRRTRDSIRLTLTTGRHDLEVGKDGFAPYRYRFRIMRGGKAEVVATLIPLSPRESSLKTHEIGKPSPPPAIAPFTAAQANEHQQEWAKYLGLQVEETNAIGMRLVLIPPGEFDMGAGEEETDAVPEERPQHRVRITKPFFIGQCEVTVVQFRKFVDATGYKTTAEESGRGITAFDATTFQWGQLAHRTWRAPGFPQKDDHPAVGLSWNDAAAFCFWLSRQERQCYGLPTEAQWEYACRAGTTTRYSCGDERERLQRVANVRDRSLDKQSLASWDDGYPFTAPVGQFDPNSFGVQDMLGNVEEWCSDWSYWYTSSTADDPTGPSSGAPSGSARSIRGGGWNHNDASSFRSAHRTYARSTDGNSGLGFRVVRTIVPSSNELPEDNNLRYRSIKVGLPIARPNPVPINIQAESLPIQFGEPLSRAALVTNPASLPGVQSWTLETRGHRGTVLTLCYSPDRSAQVSDLAETADRRSPSPSRSAQVSDLAETADRRSPDQGLSDPPIIDHPHGRLLAVGCSDGTIRLWDSNNGQLVKALLGHDGAVTSVTWSPAGKYLASASRDKTIRIWETDSARVVRILGDHLDKVTSVAWSPDGATLASGSLDATIRLWEASTGTTRVIPDAHPGGVNVVAWSPNGRTLASGGRDNAVVLWDADSAQRCRTIPAHELPVAAVAWSPDGKFLASTCPRKNAKIWDTETGRLRLDLPEHDQGDRSLAWSPDGTTVLLGGETSDGTFRVWDLEAARQVFDSDAQWQPIRAIAYAPDGSALAVARRVGEVEIRNDVFSWPRHTLPQHTGGAQIIRFSPDGLFLACGNEDGTIRLWSLASSEPTCELRSGEIPIVGMDWSPDGHAIARVGNSTSTPTIWDVNTGKKAKELNTEATTCFLSWSPEGDRLVCAGVGIFELESGKKLRTLPGYEFLGLAYSPDGKILAVADVTKVVLLQQESGEILQELVGHTDWITGFAWSPDGQKLASGARNGEICIWENRTGRLFKIFKGRQRSWVQRPGQAAHRPIEPKTLDAGHASSVFPLRWDRDGKTLITGSTTEFCVWDVEKGQVERTIPFGNGDLSPDDRLIASGGDSLIRLVRLDDGQLLHTLVSLSDGQYAVVSPNGHYRGSPGVEEEFVYVVQTDEGQETLTPEGFSTKYGWKNNPNRARTFVIGDQGE